MVEQMGYEADLLHVCALRRFDLISSDDAVRRAVSWVDAGVQSAAVLALASTYQPSTEDIDRMLADALVEANVPVMDDCQAALVVAAHVASEVSWNQRSPVDAAREITRLARLVPSADGRLRVFRGLLSEWDDSPAYRREYEHDIRREAGLLAREILGSSASEPSSGGQWIPR